MAKQESIDINLSRVGPDDWSIGLAFGVDVPEDLRDIVRFHSKSMLREFQKLREYRKHWGVPHHAD